MENGDAVKDLDAFEQQVMNTNMQVMNTVSIVSGAKDPHIMEGMLPKLSEWWFYVMLNSISQLIPFFLVEMLLIILLLDNGSDIPNTFIFSNWAAIAGKGLELEKR